MVNKTHMNLHIFSIIINGSFSEIITTKCNIYWFFYYYVIDLEYYRQKIDIADF